MSNIFKNLGPDDVAVVPTLQNEAIPITGTIVSGTYNDENIKNYSHGRFQSVYDYPYLSSSANKICDITVGYSNNSALSSSTNVENSEKINIYNQMAQVLVGHDVTGSILEFDEDGDIIAGGTKLQEVIFINLNRVLTKDEIKKGSVDFDITTGGSVTGSLSSSIALQDAGAQSDFRVNSPAGEYSFLSASNGFFEGAQGLVFYQAGVLVLTASIFGVTDGTSADFGTQEFGTYASSSDINAVLTGSSIQHAADSFRLRWQDLDFNNTVEINSTIYFCRANNRDFNYSANPTYLTGSKIRVKNSTSDQPVSYITSVGLYSPDNELLAVAKLSEPLKKTPSTELNLRVRLDY